MIREFHLADWFTLANAVCGIGALFSAMSYIETGQTRHVYYASALVLAALVFSGRRSMLDRADGSASCVSVTTSRGQTIARHLSTFAL